MTIRLVDTGWGEELTAALRADNSELRIICPFIKAGALRRLLSLRPHRVQVITRFNLRDFADGVSDVGALRMLLDAGAQVRGIKNLHAKLFLFPRQAIITSANLTKSALDRNHEFGLITEDETHIPACRNYFDRLWKRAAHDLTRDQLALWDNIVTRHRVTGGRPDYRRDLKDFGADVGIVESFSFPATVRSTDAQQAFIKFLGKSDDRVPLPYEVMAEIKRAGCHWAVAYPASARPRAVEDGATIFIGRLTSGNVNDIRIFGRAVGMKHVDDRDVATPLEIERRPWKADWPNYIRVHHAEFIAGTMSNGVSLNELMDALGPMSFAPTKRNAHADDGSNTNPRRSLMQKPAMQLSEEGQIWLGQRFEEALAIHGSVPQSVLAEFDWPDI